MKKKEKERWIEVESEGARERIRKEGQRKGERTRCVTEHVLHKLNVGRNWLEESRIFGLRKEPMKI